MKKNENTNIDDLKKNNNEISKISTLLKTCILENDKLIIQK